MEVQFVGEALLGVVCIEEAQVVIGIHTLYGFKFTLQVEYVAFIDYGIGIYYFLATSFKKRIIGGSFTPDL